MRFSVLTAALATLALTSAAPSMVKRTIPGCPDDVQSSYNFQQFTGTLGGYPPPNVYGTSSGYETCGSSYNNGGPYDACSASCGIQDAYCEEEESDKDACKSQLSACNQQCLSTGG